jgi:hypothetical protein
MEDHVRFSNKYTSYPYDVNIVGNVLLCENAFA